LAAVPLDVRCGTWQGDWNHEHVNRHHWIFFMHLHFVYYMCMSGAHKSRVQMGLAMYL